MTRMRSATVLKVLAAAALFLALALGLTAYRAFRKALAVRIERAAEVEAAAARPAAAARLAAALSERRLALVAEKESHAVAGAFQRGLGAEALEGYRRAQGDPSVLREAEKALAADAPPDSDADIAFLRAIRTLRTEAARMPVLTKPEPPAEARTSRNRLLWAAGAALAASALAYTAGRAA